MYNLAVFKIHLLFNGVEIAPKGAKMMVMKKIVSALLVVAVYTSLSLSAIAFDGSTAGEITIAGNQDGVTVNGYAARSGRAIANGSKIETGSSSSATVSVEGLGTVRLGANSSFIINFDDNGLSGSLSKGDIKVLEATTTVPVTDVEGKVLNLGEGQTASVSTAKNQAHDDGSSFASKYWWLWLVIIGGAVTGVVVAASGNDSAVSPNR